MADWYCFSVAWTAVAAWSSLTLYSVGNLVRQLATPTIGNERVFRASAITTGLSGSSEPSWTLTKGGNTTDSGVTWTEVTGNSGYQQVGSTTTWTAPHARIENMLAWMASSDRGFASSDHTQTRSGASVTFTSPGSTCVFVSVSRTTGNIPPAAGDITAGASAAMTAVVFGTFGILGGGDWSGFDFTGSSGADIDQSLVIGNGPGYYRLRNCTFNTTSGTNNSFTLGQSGTVKIRLDGPTFNIGQAINAPGSGANARIFIENATWGGTLPSSVFSFAGPSDLEIHGSDLSGFDSGSNTLFNSSSYVSRIRAINCKLGAGVITAATTTAGDPAEYQIINCDSGATGYRNEWHRSLGDITTNTTYTMTGGATDGVEAVSHKWTTNANATIIAPLEGPVLSIWNTLTSGTHTATVQILSNATLNNNDIWLELETLGSASYPISTVADDGIATSITADAAQASSSASGRSLSGATMQQLQVAFSPALVGMIEGRIKLAKPSTTVYVNPQLIVT